MWYLNWMQTRTKIYHDFLDGLLLELLSGLAFLNWSKEKTTTWFLPPSVLHVMIASSETWTIRIIAVTITAGAIKRLNHFIEAETRWAQETQWIYWVPKNPYNTCLHISIEHVSARVCAMTFNDTGELCAIVTSFCRCLHSVCMCGGNNNLAAELSLNLILFCAAPAANLKAILSSVDEITEQRWQICPTRVRGE